MSEGNDNTNLPELVAVLTDVPATTIQDVFRRCRALEHLSACGTTTTDALHAAIRSLVVRVSLDCVLTLRVAAAEAVWKVGGRSDLALPFLAWALKDEYWGVSQKAIEVLAEMGPSAHEAVPDLINLAERRLDGGPFHYENFGIGNNKASLLALVATALGDCGRGIRHVDAARRILNRMVDCKDVDACAAATVAIEKLKDVSSY